MTQSWFRNIFSQAFQALGHMHRHAVMHCDIKEPNLMLRTKDYKSPLVVIIDLGLAKSFDVDQSGGTPGYMPPEVVDLFTGGTGAWFPRGDVFSMGVTMFQVIADMVPDEKIGKMGMFQGDNWAELTKTKQPPFEGLTIPEMRQFLMGCLQKDRRVRLTAPQVLELPWFKGVGTYQGPPLTARPTMTMTSPRWAAPTPMAPMMGSMAAGAQMTSTMAGWAPSVAYTSPRVVSAPTLSYASPTMSYASP